MIVRLSRECTLQVENCGKCICISLVRVRDTNIDFVSSGALQLRFPFIKEVCKLRILQI
jgi:hypothetical protein